MNWFLNWNSEFWIWSYKNGQYCNWTGSWNGMWKIWKWTWVQIEVECEETEFACKEFESDHEVIEIDLEESEVQIEHEIEFIFIEWNSNLKNLQLWIDCVVSIKLNNPLGKWNLKYVFEDIKYFSLSYASWLVHLTYSMTIFCNQCTLRESIWIECHFVLCNSW